MDTSNLQSGQRNVGKKIDLKSWPFLLGRKSRIYACFLDNHQCKKLLQADRVCEAKQPAQIHFLKKREWGKIVAKRLGVFF